MFTDDGGVSWHDGSLKEDVVLYGIRFSDKRRGWIAGEFGRIFNTKDAGRSWTAIPESTGGGVSLFCLDVDIRRCPLYAPPGLMYHDPGMRKCMPFSFGACSKKHSTHAGGLPHAIGIYFRLNKLHGVIYRKPACHASSGSIYVNRWSSS